MDNGSIEYHCIILAAGCGSRMRELCFEPIDDDLPSKIEEEVRRAVSSWLPYINIQEVNTLTEEQDQNKIHVEIKFSTTLSPQ